jgi:FKBP-type peptidyl-prolyl cis-trans isomerase
MRRKGVGSILVAVGIAMAFTLNGCLDTSSDYYDFNKTLFEDIEKIQDYLDANGIDATLDSTTGIFITIHDHPGGYKPAKNGIIKAHYVGHTLSGIKFGSTYSTGIPIAYPLSRGSEKGMTFGFDLGLASISEGDSATLYVPSPLCYQDKEEGVIPANSILVYTVRFLDIHLLEEDIEKIDEYINNHGMTPEIDQKFGTRYVIHRNGTGDLPKSGDAVSVHYVGQLLNGTEFDSSYPSNTPLTFFYGQEKVIIGFELGLSNLQEGDSATFFIPSTYGYQDREAGNIPMNSVLVFGVDKIKYEGN